MCSVQDGDGDTPVPRSAVSVDRVCMKCKVAKPVVVTRVNDALCRDCFIVYVVHKFRATIGKSHLIRDGEEILLAFSGGPCSSALLHLVQEGLSQRAHKRLRFKPSLVHIDEMGVLDLPSEQREKTNTAVLDVLRSTGYPCYISSLEQALDLPDGSGAQKAGQGHPPCWCLDSGEGLENFNSAKHDKRLADSFKNIKSTTAKEDYIKKLRNQLLTAIAHCYSYSKVMLADTSSRLAIRILSDIGQGRGGQVSADTCFADERHGDIMFVRPIREVTSKEVAMYNSLHRVEPIFVPTLTTQAQRGSSIDHLTECFVTGLQAEFPSTVSNITRTAGKLDSVVRTGTEDFCVLCQSPLDTNVGEASALRAVEFSDMLSKRGCDPGSMTSGCCGEGDGSCQSSKVNSLQRTDVIKALCYGCRLTAKDMTDVSQLPSHVIHEATSRINRLRMREDIQDFLLDGDS
ncbi:cytoplasmic tRNA 2-thiolation protein 2-A-like isoform X1 [Haliotis rubra]|uniref:cytoplasmic tRNA 2-thiolation protein 2-A-like isoform X1 n=1 Tax=Haliotis rubra TaxID=36100 RepID=UPI001EE6009D|nr:cytoplasmic tRNA 2-thiolation protein 2-A-like isoform X1 [Haliotis rubra]